MDKKNIAILVAMMVVLAVPFLMRKESESILNPDGRVIVITPHNEAIRYEFGQAFRDWYLDKTGQDIVVDWRVIGGTSEIVKKIESDYLSSFREYWTTEVERPWNLEVQEAFFNYRQEIDDSPQDDSIPEMARRRFLNSEVSCGLDVFFGGGSYDFIRQARAGSLVDAGLLEKHPEWFTEGHFPQTYAGEPFWDPEGRWYGAVLSTFGIIYNTDGLERVGYDGIPSQWEDLASPLFFGEVALADPTKSGSITKAFEMIVQKAMQDLYAAYLAEGLNPAEAEARAVPEGWNRGMQLIMLISANARYFTDSSTKPPLDVSQGDCVVGMSIDFYGRQQAEFNILRGGTDRFGYIAPKAATTVSVDPVGMFRGAPNPEYARAFIEFILSPEGQRIWNYKPGTPGGPRQYALRRSPAIRPLYEPEHRQYRSDPDVNDYETAGDFVYRSSWTGRLFSPLRYVIRTAMMDPLDELKLAWKAIIDARADGREADARQALDTLQNVEVIGYERAAGEINEVLRSRNKIEEVKLSRQLADTFRAQYLKAYLEASGKAVAESR